MFELRNGEDWNIANYWLKTKAAPTTSLITETLEVMVDNQKLLLETDTVALEDLSLSMKRNSIIIALIGLFLAILITIFIVNSITKPIFELNENINSITNGDLTTEVVVTGNDEIAAMSLSMKAMVTKLKEIIGFVSRASENIASASQQMSSTAQQMSQGSTEQAASTEEVSSSMEQMTANIQQNADNSQQTEKIALLSAESVKNGAESSSSAVKSMNEVAEKIQIINDIAFQPNILALNAAVEAARAGEQ